MLNRNRIMGAALTATLALALAGCGSSSATSATPGSSSSGSSGSTPGSTSGTPAAAPVSPSGPKQKVIFWQFDSSQPAVDAYKKEITDFEAKNPAIEVDMQIVPWSSQQQKITTALATGALPDVSMLGNDVVSQFAKNSLQPLDSYMADWAKQDGVDPATDVWPGDKGYYYLDGHWYGSPVAAETRMLYYRTDLFTKAGLDPAKPPTTWDEFQADAIKLKTVAKIPIAVPMSKDYATVQTFMSIYLGYGASLLNAQGQCGLNTPEFKTALTYYTGLYKQGLTPPDSINYTGDQIQSAFTSGQAAMVVGGPGMWALTQKDPTLKGNVKIGGIPAGPKGQFGFLGGWPLVMWKTSQHKDAAAAWIHYATSAKGGINTLSQGAGFIPARPSLLKAAPWTANPDALFITQLTKAAPYQYPHAGIPQMGVLETSTIQNAVQRVASGAQDVDASTSQLCQEMNSILSK